MSTALLSPPHVPAPVGMPETLAQRLKTCSVVTYSERALYRLPWCGLHPRPGRHVLPVRGAGNPGAFERSLFRALEWIAIDQSVAQGTPFANPLIVHPRDICERLCWRATQPQFRAIEDAFETLCRIKVQGAPEDGSRSFGVLSSAAAASPRGGGQNQICPDFILHFDQRFVDSVNAGRLVPVNWGLWVALQDPSAQRLLEILELEWPGRERGTTATFDLDFLAARMPLRASFGRVQRQALFAQAHEELIRNGYLSEVDLRPSDRFRYHPGRTFEAMRYRLKENHERLVLTGIRTQASHEQRRNAHNAAAPSSSSR